MSAISVPVEIMTHIFDMLDETPPESPHGVEKHREMSRALMALRLTCKDLEPIATRQLFRTFCFSACYDSWFKLGRIASNQKFAMHLQTLAFDNRNNFTFSYELMVKAFDSAGPQPLDLAFFPNLKVIKAGTEWVLSKKGRSKVQIPLGQCTIHPSSFSTHMPAVWSVLEGLAYTPFYDFTLTSLSCKLGEDHWPYTSSLPFNGLRSLRLHYDGAYSNPDDLRADIDLLSRLHDLPNLENFHLDQYFLGRCDASWWRLEFMTNVLEQLATKKWPKLRRLDLRYLATTVEDLKAFLAPHARMLETFDLYSGLVCARVTPEEEMQRVFLPHWIRTVICRKGTGGAPFKHIGGQPEGSFEADDWEDDVEDELSAQEDEHFFDEDAYSETEHSTDGHSGHENFDGEPEIEHSGDGHSTHEHSDIEHHSGHGQSGHEHSEIGHHSGDGHSDHENCDIGRPEV